MGVDGVTAAEYEVNLESNLDVCSAGSSQSLPVRRHYIPKADGTSGRWVYRHLRIGAEGDTDVA